MPLLIELFVDHVREDLPAEDLVPTDLVRLRLSDRRAGDVRGVKDTCGGCGGGDDGRGARETGALRGRTGGPGVVGSTSSLGTGLRLTELVRRARPVSGSTLELGLKRETLYMFAALYMPARLPCCQGGGILGNWTARAWTTSSESEVKDLALVNTLASLPFLSEVWDPGSRYEDCGECGLGSAVALVGETCLTSCSDCAPCRNVNRPEERRKSSDGALPYV